MIMEKWRLQLQSEGCSQNAVAAHASFLASARHQATPSAHRQLSSEQQRLQGLRQFELRPAAQRRTQQHRPSLERQPGARSTVLRYVWQPLSSDGRPGAVADGRLLARRAAPYPSKLCIHPWLLQAAADLFGMATLDDVPALLARLRSRGKVQQAAAAKALSEIARRGDDGCAAIAAAGGTAALAEALCSSSTAAVQQHAITALKVVSLSSAEQRAALRASGVVATMAQLLRQPGAVGEAAAGAMCCLTAKDGALEECAAFAAAGGISALIWALEHGTQAAQHAGILTMLFIANQDRCYATALAAAGAVPPLVSLLSRGDADQQRNALLALTNIALVPPGAAAAVQTGAVPALAERLCSADPGVQGQAACALENIAAHSGSAILEHPEALGTLVSLLGGSQGTSGSSSNSAQGRRSEDSGSGSSSGCSSSSNWVLSLAGSDSITFCRPVVSVVKHAAGALHNLAGTGRQACLAVLAAGAVPPLVHLLHCQHDQDALQYAVGALENLLRFTDCRSQLPAALAVAALQHIQQGSTRQEVREMAGVLLQQLTDPVEAVGGAMSASQQAAIASDAAAADEVAAAPAAAAAGAASAAAEAETAALPPVPSTVPAAPPPVPSSRPPAPRICAAPGCGTTNGLRRCGGCGTVRYCSEACCKAHWQAHKAECRRLQAERARAGAAAPDAGSAQ